MSDSQKGRIAAITGSAQGIGRALAVALAQRGATVVLLDIIDTSETEALVRAAGGEVLSLRADVSRAEDWAAAAAAIDQRFGRLDILVNNAGIYPFTHFDALDYELWSKVLRINLDGAFLGAKALVPLMRKNKWGRIVNLASASIAGETPGFVHYMASKMGVVGLTRGLANDLGPDGITVNAVAPSVTDTPGTRVSPDAAKEAVWSRQPIRRFAQPDDITGAILFFTSDDAAFITGQMLVVDGGLTKN